METFSVKTSVHEELVDITPQVRSAVQKSGVKTGICIIYTPHTTAGITINENADPTVKSDIIKGLRHLDFDSVSFRHMEGNSPSHLLSSIIGCSETIIVEKGSPVLGTWQGIFFCEFDGPRSRKCMVQVIPG